jgi:hypothetical protein
MRLLAMQRLLLLLILATGLLPAAEYKAGVAAVSINPAGPIYLTGYASRTHPSEGILHDLKAKALAIEDRAGKRTVIVTTDLIGLPRAITDPVAARALKEYGIERARLLFNSSHTHGGPHIASNLNLLFELAPPDAAAVDGYARKLREDLHQVIGEAVQKLAPADLWFGNGKAHFGVNRRQPTPSGVKIGVNPEGPTDPDVPVLKVTSPDGKVLALLFGYACHNTTLGGDIYQVHGDYAGFAQSDVESAHPGATAMFVELCGADQNPNPRGKVEQARQYGKALADEVMRVAGSPMAKMRGNIRAAFQIVELEFAAYSREQLESAARDKNPYKVRHAKAMLQRLDSGNPIRRYPYPVQAIQFGKDLTIVALGGEVVVGYCLWVKQTYGDSGILIAGYSNDVMSYIPTARILQEGGYEPVDSMLYYGLPGPYKGDVEERIHATIRQVLQRVGRKPLH